jgi:hypothetical protein
MEELMHARKLCLALLWFLLLGSLACESPPPTTESLSSGFSFCLPTPPSLSDPVVSAPSGSHLLAHAPLYYLAGGQLDVTLTIPACNSIGGVHWGTIDLPTSSGIDVSTWYSIVANTTLADGRHRVTVRINTQPWTNGMSLPVTVSVVSASGGFPSADFSFTVAGVKEIGGDLTMRIPQTQLTEQLVSTVYGMFGDFSTVVDGYTLDNVDYGQTNITVDAASPHISIAFEVERPDYRCNLRVHAQGAFNITTSLTATWIGNPDISVDFVTSNPAQILICLAEGGGGDINAAKQAIADQIIQLITNQLSSLHCGPFSCSGFIQSITPTPGELQIDLRVLSAFDRVTVDVPYAAPTAASFPLRAGESVTLLAGGDANVCLSESGACSSVKSGPPGLFNYGAGGDLPIPQGYTNGCTAEDPCVIEWPERIGARNAMPNVARTASLLPRPDLNVGTLLVSQSSTADASGFCKVTAHPLDIDHVAFGVNERSGSHGSGNYQLQVAWPPTELVGAIDACN